MSKSFVSPGVFITETDASFLAAGVGTIGAAILGSAPKGPAFVPVTVTNYDEFISVFGDLDPDHMLGYAARAYLRNSGVANVVRVLGPSGRTVNGTAVTPGYTADTIKAIVALTGTASAHVMALLEVTGSVTGFVVTDLGNDEFYVQISGNTSPVVTTTASFLTSSANYIKKVLNTDPTQYSTYGYYVRHVYDYAFKAFGGGAGAATYSSASYSLTNFAFGFNSGSTPWIKSQIFGGATEYNMFRVHTLGHGEVENGRFKISVTNVRPSVAPTVSEFGKFDLEVRTFGDTDTSKSVVELFPNVSFDPTDPGYVGRVIGDRFLQYDPDRSKMVEFGTYPNRSKLIRVEITTGSLPASALPWGFRGLAKPDLGYTSGSAANEGGLTTSVSSAVKDLPLVASLLDKATQSEASEAVYWGVETVLSGSIVSRLALLSTMTGSDAAFSLSKVSGSALNNLVYNASNPTDNLKSPGNSTAATTLEPSLAKFTVPIAFGFDGFDRRLANPLANESQLASVSQLGVQALRQAVEIVADPDFIDINLLAIPGVYSSKVVDFAMTKIQNRADAFYVPDVSGSSVTSIVNEVRGRGFDTNYAAVYYPSIKVFDDVNSIAVQVPASIPILGVFAYTDRIAHPWFAPAGLNRGGLSRDTIGFDVLTIVDQLTQTERDTLQENRINPIARFPDVPSGVVWGQKTLQLKSSALDRVNVRRLLIRAKKLVASAVKFLVFEPNDVNTQTRFRQLVNPILADIQQKQGLTRFQVVMDSTTNPPEVVDRNVLAGKILLVPTRSAEFLSIDFVVGSSGASFDEI